MFKFASKNGLLWSFGGSIRSIAKSLDSLGCKLQEVVPLPQRCGHRKILSLQGKKPTVAQGTWVAPNATVVGNVEIGVHSAVWYGAVLRGYVNKIKIGSFSSIGDRVIIHVSSGRLSPDANPTVIGNKVTVEQGAILHACTINDNSKVESGAIVFDGAVVETNSIVGAGSIVTAGKRIPTGELWSGSPAKFERKLTAEEIANLSKTAESIQELAEKHDQETSKHPQEVYVDNYITNHVKERWMTKDTVEVLH